MAKGIAAVATSRGLHVSAIARWRAGLRAARGLIEGASAQKKSEKVFKKKGEATAEAAVASQAYLLQRMQAVVATVCPEGQVEGVCHL